MNRLLEIATELSGLYGNRAGLSVHKKHIELDLAARIVFITPVEGWTGKNAEQREIEAQRAFAADASVSEMRETLRVIDVGLSDIEADIATLEAERRAYEWMIRGRLADALSGRQNEHGDVAEAAFDDATDEAAWTAQPVHIGPEDIVEDDVPF